MRVDGPPRDAPATECPYLEGQSFVQNYFFGTDASLHEAAHLLGSGWRRFGTFFFRPQCPACQACVPVRLDVEALSPSSSQRRIWRKNEDVEFSVVPLEYCDDYYELYRQHSSDRFDKPSDPEDFRRTFFEAAVPAFLNE